MRKRSVRRRHSSEEGGGVPVDSFSDIAFLLIIFFILTTTLTQTTGFMSELPAGEKSQEQTEDKTPTIQLHDNGITFNDEKDISMDQLKQHLADLELAEKEDDNDKVVLLEATGQVPYETYYQVMSAITYAGGAVGIVREEEGEGP